MNFNTLLKQSIVALVVTLSFVAASSCSKKKPQDQGAANSDSSRIYTGSDAGSAPGTVDTSSQKSGTSESGAVAIGRAGSTTGTAHSSSGQSVAMGTPPSTAEQGSPSKPVAQAPTPPPPPNCYQVSFKHKENASHNSDEACSQHKNIIKIKHKEYNQQSLCVRVNNTPVKFQVHKKNKDEVIVGSVAGPNSTITATYCIKKNTCRTDCKVPKDEFLDAIGGTDDKIALWDSTDTGAAELDAKVKKELAEFNETQGGGKGKAFKDWISDDGSATCENPKQAQKDSGSKQPG